MCAVLFFLPSATLHLCYILAITMTALRMSQLWNGIFLQKFGVENLTSTLSNHTAFSNYSGGEQSSTLDIISSNDFIFYLSIQMLYSFIFTKTPVLFFNQRLKVTDTPVISVWMCLVSPVFIYLLLRTYPLVPEAMADEIIKTFYTFYPILPIFLLNLVWSILSFIYYYLMHMKIVIKTYTRLYTQFGWQILIENQWVRLKVPTVLRLFWMIRFGLHISQLGLQYLYAPKDPDSTEGVQMFLSGVLHEIAVHSVSTMIAVLGVSATISPIANAIGNLARLFIGGDKDGAENIGTVSSVLFFILALQTGLPDLTPSNRVIRLWRNFSLLSTAILHFIHTMLHTVMMQLSTSHIVNRQKHARALAMAAALVILPIWFIVHLWISNPIGTWMLALTAFCLELIVKVTVTIIVYILFFIDTQSETFWEGLDDYVYYVKATGSTIEFISGIFLFINGAWIFVFESRGIIRAFMICIHAYFNIFQLGKDGWKKFQNRRMAVQKIKSLEQASPELLSRHNDVCAICYQELNSACITPCGHLFHALCLRKWLYVQDSCPLCHKEIMVFKDGEEKDEGGGEEEAEEEEEDSDDD